MLILRSCQFPNESPSDRPRSGNPHINTPCYQKRDPASGTGWLLHVPQDCVKTPALTVARAGSFQVPAIAAEVGPEAAKRFFEFFTVPIRNKNTRFAYYHAIGQFLDWCAEAGFRAKISNRLMWRLTSSSTQAHRPP